MLLRRARFGLAVLMLGLVAGCGGGGTTELSEAAEAWCRDPGNAEALDAQLMSLGVNFRTPGPGTDEASLVADGFVKAWPVAELDGNHRYLASQDDYDRVCAAAYEDR